MQAIELKDFLSFYALSDLQWAPDGHAAALIAHRADEGKNGYDSNLWLYTPGKPLRQLTAQGDVKSFVWDGSEALLFPTLRDEADKALRASGEEHTAFYRLPLSGGEAERVFTVPLNASVIGKLAPSTYVLKARKDLEKEARLKNLTGEARREALKQLSIEREHFTVFDEYPFWFNGSGVINKTRVGLFLFNSATGALTPITTPLFDVEGVKVCPEDGVVVYHGGDFDTRRDFRTGIRLYDFATGKTSQVVPQDIYRIRQVDFWAGQVVFAGTDMGEYDYSQTPDLWRVPAEGGQPVRLGCSALTIGNPVGSDVRYGGGTCFKAEDDTLYLISGLEDNARLVRLDLNGRLTPVWEGEGTVDLFDVCKGRLICVAMQDMRLQELFTVEPDGLRQVSAFNQEWCDSHEIIKPEQVRFTDPDGFEIHGFVLKPAHFDPSKTYPGILDIHGGPRLCYGPVYYHEMQVWANKGYFVFFANPRGSDARGDEFAFIRGKYGTVEYQNLMDFTDCVLARYPQLDANRLGVTGGSYGGFMTNWIIGHTHRFACAASQRSISNFVSMEGTSDCGRTFVDGHLAAHTTQDVAKVWAQSPLSAADQCTTPTLFIHSEEDYRCWKIEGLQMFNAIRSHGVEARLCLFKGENHELSRGGKPKNRVKRLQEITRWMDHYLRP